MRNSILMLSTLVFSTLFLYYNAPGEIGFPFSDMVIPAQTWIYFLFEHLILIILSLVIYDLTREYKMSALVFVLIQVIDTVDYCLTYGEPWFDSRVFTWNTIKVGIMSISILYEKHGQ